MGNFSSHWSTLVCKVVWSKEFCKISMRTSSSSRPDMESIFLSRVEGRGFHVEGEGTMSRVEGNIFFFNFFFFWKR